MHGVVSLHTKTPEIHKKRAAVSLLARWQAGWMFNHPSLSKPPVPCVERNSPSSNATSLGWLGWTGGRPNEKYYLGIGKDALCY